MSYLALARRFRPSDFSEILAQKHITRTLENAIATGRISHAYLFCGPRGTGKTSTARVLAKSLNCQQGPTPTPCGKCTNCLEIKAGISPDVFEIDAASNRGIDDIRQLRENVRYAPVGSRYKVYIIDEVHRLTGEAFDALLKTLEEPPAHVIFIFATTDPQALPATILSRTQRFDFRRVPLGSLAETVHNISRAEGVEIDPKAASLIARKADGSLRDALSLLDQLISFSEGKITAELASEVLGLVKGEFLYALLEAMLGGRIADAFGLYGQYLADGGDTDALADELSAVIGKFLLVASGVRDAHLLDMDTGEVERAAAVIAGRDPADMVRMVRILSEYSADKKAGVDPVIAMEVALARMTNLDRTVDVARLLQVIESNQVQAPAGHPVGAFPRKNNPPAFPMGAVAVSSADHHEEELVSVAKATDLGDYSAQSGSIDPADTTRWWPDFLRHIKKTSLAIWSNLQHAVPEYVNGTVKIKVPAKNDFLYRYLAKENKELIIAQLRQFLRPEVQVVIVQADFSAPTAGADDSGKDPTMPLANLPAGGEVYGSRAKGAPRGSIKKKAEEFLMRHPQAKKLHDLLGGEFVAYEGSDQ